MKRAGSFSNKVMAVLLSMAMFFMPVLQSITVYAAELGSGAEETGTMPERAEEIIDTGAANESASDAELSGGALSDGGTMDGTAIGNETSEEPASSDPAAAIEPVRATASSFAKVGGWNECIYAEIAGVSDADVTAVSYSGTMTGSLAGQDLDYLVRSNGNGGVRIDIPGLKEGTYTLSVKVGANTLTKDNIAVYAYDRSGFAHFNYTSGVGAYKDDGTLKDNAIVLYVTDANKNDVTLTCGSITVKGIGNILNSVGQASTGGLASNGGKANTNQGIIKELAKANKPLVVRFIGTVSESGLYTKGTYNAASPNLIEGLTVYSSVDNGGTAGDNGHMARIQSGKDITLEGIGYDATIDGWGFHYICQSSDPSLGKSFEVRNLTFINTPEDAVGMEGQQASKNTSSDLTASVERCWIHHNEFYCPRISSPAESDKSEGDGSVDFKRGQYFTCSYNYYEGCHKTNLVGSADYSLQFNLSYHHNHWYMCKARGPLTRNANVHMYNNIVDMQTDYAQNTRANAYIFSEYNLFYACKSPQAVEGGAIKSYHDSITSVIWNKGSQATVVSDKSQYVSNACQFQARGIKYDKFDTDAALSYIPDNNYKLNTDFTELRKVIASQTGVMSQSPKLPSEVTAAEYSMVPDSVSINTPDLPFALKAPTKISKTVYAFTVGTNFNLKVAYASGNVGVLTDEAGENLLEGDGEVTNLPAGTYMIQPLTFQPGAYLKGTTAVFKEITINTLEISAVDPNMHYHKWVKDTSRSQEPTCTEGGKYYYTCSVTTPACTESGEKAEDVAARGHAYSSAWTIDVPATETTPGSKSHHCTRCGAKADVTEIPVGSTEIGGSGGGTGGATVGGEYILTFDAASKKPVDEAGFFQVTGSYSNSKGAVTVNGTTYTDCLKMEKSTKVAFECNEGAKLVLVFSQTGKKVNVDGKAYTTDSEGTVTIESLAAGSHVVTKADSINLYYVSVDNGDVSVEVYTLSFEYNYDEAPEARTVTVVSGTRYDSAAQMVPQAFTRKGYALKGLYTDASCQNAVAYPYIVNGNAVFYAEWQESDEPMVASYSLIFNSNGGSAVATAQVAANEIYEIRQKPTREGYAFAGWYDAAEGGNPIDKVDGSQLTGNYIVYAHWNAAEMVKHVLDCSKDLATVVDESGNITAKTTVNGFTIHAAEGEVNKVKYYMTVKKPSDKATGTVLYTNGVRLTDTGIAGNEDGMLKAMEFTAESNGRLTVEMALSGKAESGKTYELVLARKAADGSYEEVGKTPIDKGTTKVTKEFEFDSAGVYYLYAQGDKGIVYYSLKVTEEQYTILYRPGEGTAPEGLVSTTAKAGEVIAIGDCTPASGRIFKGWSADDGQTVFKDTYTVKAEDAQDGVITLTAIYEASNSNTGEDTPKVPEDGLSVELLGGKNYTYTGCPVRPEIRVCNVAGGVEYELIENVDYVVKYANNIKANAYGDSEGEHPGEAFETSEKKLPKITVTGKGNYGGSKTIFFNIKRKNLSDADVYKGGIVLVSGAKAVPTLVHSGIKLGAKDYVIDGDPARTYQTGEENPSVKVKAAENGNYYGSVELPVIVVDSKVALAQHTFTVSLSKNYVAEYNGTEQKPGEQDLVVKANVVDNTVLRNGMDYEVSYSADTVNAGVVKFTVVGINEYTGAISQTYKINPRKITFEDKVVSLTSETYEFVGTGVTIPKSEITVVDHGLVLKQGRDYKVTYSNNKKVGTGKYNVVFQGNYQGSSPCKGSFTIKAKTLNNDTAEVVIPDKVYSKKSFYKSAPIVTVDGIALKASDYNIVGYSYSLDQGATWMPMDNSNKLELGEAQIYADVRVKLTGKGNYTTPTGEGETDFYGYYRVCKKSDSLIDMTKAKVTFYEDAQMTRNTTKLQYTGGGAKAEALKVEVKMGKEFVELQPDQYVAHWTNNVNKGRATVVITGNGNKTSCVDDQGALKNELAFVGSKNATISIVALDLKTKANVRGDMAALGGDILKAVLEKVNR